MKPHYTVRYIAWVGGVLMHRTGLLVYTKH